MLNNFRKVKKESNESSESFILLSTSKTFNNVKPILKIILMRLYNLKLSSSKSDKQIKSNKKSES